MLWPFVLIDITTLRVILDSRFTAGEVAGPTSKLLLQNGVDFLLLQNGTDNLLIHS